MFWNLLMHVFLMFGAMVDTSPDAAHLPGATNVDIEGCYHSPLGAAEGRAWYGDEQFLEQWVHHLG